MELTSMGVEVWPHLPNSEPDAPYCGLADCFAAAAAGAPMRKLWRVSLLTVVANSLISMYWFFSTPVKCWRVLVAGQKTSIASILAL